MAVAESAEPSVERIRRCAGQTPKKSSHRPFGGIDNYLGRCGMNEYGQNLFLGSPAALEIQKAFVGSMRTTEAEDPKFFFARVTYGFPPQQLIYAQSSGCSSLSHAFDGNRVLPLEGQQAAYDLLVQARM